MTTITATQLKLKTQNESIVLLDIRSARERVHFHIGGQHVSLTKLQTKIPEEIISLKEEVIIICCSSISGKRSETARQILEKAGFKNIKILAGGIYTWNRIYPKEKIKSL